ncbi:hypothetical protein AVEN_41041-1 [Araneus ventricosus]|uniref:Uncharacterized protein n=1 Tax=Araneus ventricosus TaxID=182803 RepID=A0A4Y2CKH0_ARAVE|nr:hypothetical protein AVEN_41041-1 [Araneus ventricosus]
MGRFDHSSETEQSNMKVLRASILLAWVDIPPQQFQQHVELLPKRNSAAIKARGLSRRLVLRSKVHIHKRKAFQTVFIWVGLAFGI